METKNFIKNFRPRANVKIKFLVPAIFLLLFLAGPAVKKAGAATLYFSPSSGSYTAGQTFSVSVYVSSSNQAMNAASGVVSFPADKLQLTSLSKSGSIFNFWAQEPSFSNSDGTFHFEGGVYSPGFTGSAGKIISATFKVKTVGTARLAFSSGLVLANDGLATEILTGLAAAGTQFTLVPPREVGPVPAAPNIASATHPDSDEWYADKNPGFNWTVSADVTGARISYDRSSVSTPAVVYEPAVPAKQLNDVGDGIWYFHAQFRNANGWGGIGHYRFQIDTQPPEDPTINFVGGQETESLRPVVVLDSEDALSGIDHFEIKIDTGDFAAIPGDQEAKCSPYLLPSTKIGRHTLFVRVFDKAGNFASSSVEFTIKKAAITEVTPLFISPYFLIAPLIVLIVILAFLLWNNWRKIRQFKKKYK